MNRSILLVSLLLSTSAYTVAWAANDPNCRTMNKSGLVSPQRLGIISKELLAYSSVDEPSLLKKENRQPTVFKFWVKDRLLGGSPALAGTAGIGLNKAPYHQIILTYGLLEAAQSEAEAAAAVAHEVAHLAHRHGEAVQKMLVDLIIAWLDAHKEAPQSTEVEIAAAIDKALKDPASVKKVTDFKKTLEREADENGLALMTLIVDPKTKKARYDAEEASRGMESFWHWLACLGFPPHQEDPTHDSLATRIDTLRQRAAQLKGIELHVNNLGKQPVFDANIP